MEHIGIKCLCILGDLELMVNHVKNKYEIKKSRLKNMPKECGM